MSDFAGSNMTKSPSKTALEIAPHVAISDLRPGARGGLDPRFRPIEGIRAAEEVIEQIAFSIRSGAYRPGDRLPNTHELAAAMRVSRPIVIDACRVLADAGVVKSQRGHTGGITVITDNIPISLLRLANGRGIIDLTELLEARRPVEMEIALLAGQRATSHDFALLRSSVVELEQLHSTTDLKARLKCDHLFHYAMGRAARSELLADYQHEILSNLAVLLDDYKDQPFSEILTTHKETLAALESREAKAIRTAMDRHLGGLEAIVRDRKGAS